MNKGKLNGLDLFSGYGGISLALREYVTPITYCEIEKYAQGILLSRMDDELLPFAPIWNDVTTLDGTKFRGLVDIIYGGFPCQDISVAGKGAGLEGKRSGLFYEICRLIKEASPSFVFLENVANIRAKGSVEVSEELATLGYDCRFGCISAAEVGANHKRDRWFCLAFKTEVADSISERTQVQTSGELATIELLRGFGQNWKNIQRPSSDSIGERLSERSGQDVQSEITQTIGQDANNLCTQGEAERGGWWTIEPDVGRAFNGFASWLDENKHHIYKSHKRIISYAYAQEGRPEEVLRVLLRGDSPEEIQREAGRQGLVSSKEVLQSYMLGIQKRKINESWLLLESEKIPKEELRSLWLTQDASCSPYRSGRIKQPKREHSNPLQVLSQLLALDAEEAWAAYSGKDARTGNDWGEGWEEGFSRVANGVPFRVDRIKALGNGVVPLQVKTAFEILMGITA